MVVLCGGCGDDTFLEVYCNWSVDESLYSVCVFLGGELLRLGVGFGGVDEVSKSSVRNVRGK